jgi:hypothetical protein
MRLSRNRDGRVRMVFRPIVTDTGSMLVCCRGCVGAMGLASLWRGDIHVYVFLCDYCSGQYN